MSNSISFSASLTITTLSSNLWICRNRVVLAHVATSTKGLISYFHSQRIKVTSALVTNSAYHYLATSISLLSIRKDTTHTPWIYLWRWTVYSLVTTSFSADRFLSDLGGIYINIHQFCFIQKSFTFALKNQHGCK